LPTIGKRPKKNIKNKSMYEGYKILEISEN